MNGPPGGITSLVRTARTSSNRAEIMPNPTCLVIGHRRVEVVPTASDFHPTALGRCAGQWAPADATVAQPGIRPGAAPTRWAVLG